jgi:hypothetical protein
MTALAAVPMVSIALGARSAALPKIVVTKDPNCGCCAGWVDHLRGAGFPVDVVDSAEINRVKARLGVPHELQACHTAVVGGYIIEGHVPVSAIQRVLTEKPHGKGLAVPGMPVGSPGMNIEGAPPEEYTVFLFGSFGHRQHARFKQASELSD